MADGMDPFPFSAADIRCLLLYRSSSIFTRNGKLRRQNSGSVILSRHGLLRFRLRNSHRQHGKQQKNGTSPDERTQRNQGLTRVQGVNYLFTHPASFTASAGNSGLVGTDSTTRQARFLHSNELQKSSERFGGMKYLP